MARITQPYSALNRGDYQVLNRTALIAYAGLSTTLIVQTGSARATWNRDDAAMVNSGTVIQGAGAARWVRQFEGPIHAYWFVAGTVVGDQTTALTAALTAATTALKALHLGAFRWDYSTGLVLDVAKTRLVGEGAELRYTGVTGTALSFTSSSASPYVLNQNAVEDVRITGPGYAIAGVIGAKFEGVVSGEVAHIRTSGLSVSAFATNYYYGNYAYIINHYGGSSHSGGVGLDFPAGVTGGGERITWHGSSIFNNQLGIRHANTSGALHLTQVSLDYNVKQIELNGGRAMLSQCHIEGSATYGSTPPITLTGDASLSIEQGWILSTATLPNAYSAFFDIAVNATVSLTDVFANALRNTANRLATGLGRLLIRGTRSYATNDLPTITSEATSRTVDPTFIDTAILEDWYIFADTATITSRFVGANMNLTRSATGGVGNTSSLKISKTFGGGSACEAALLIPVRNIGEMLNVEFSMAKPGAQTGPVSLAYSWVKIDARPNGYSPEIRKTQAIGSVTITYTATAVAHTLYGTAQPMSKAPTWATHLIVNFNLSSWTGPGDLFIDGVFATAY